MRRTTAFRSGDQFRMGDRLVRLAEREAISGAYVVNESTGMATVNSGDSRITTDDDRITGNLSETVSTTVAGAAGTVEHSPPFRAPDETPVMLVATQIPSNDERAIVVVVELPALSERLLGSGEASNEGGTLSVTNDRGRVVLSDNHSQILTRDPTADGLDERANATGFYSHSAGGGTAVGYSGVEGQPWTVLHRVPSEQAYALKSTVGDRIVVLLGVLLLGLGVVGATIGRNTVRRLSDLEAHAAALDDGDLETPIETGREDEFGSVYDSLDRMRRSLRDQIDAVETERQRVEEAKASAQEARAEAEAAHREASTLATSLEARAQEFGESMELAADGDLTQRLDTDLETEAMRSIATAFNEMIEQLEETVSEIRSFASAVDEASDTVDTRSAAIRQASERASVSIEDISSAAAKQEEQLSRIDDSVSDLSKAIEEIADASDEVADRSRRAAQRGDAGRDLAETSASTMRRIERQADETAADIEQFEADIERVGDITTLIEDIADRTNMLALNASIEAARAGEDGDGFGVVADEIKRLSSEVQSATHEIDEIVEDVRDSAGDAATEMRTMQTTVEDGTETIEAGLREIEAIVDLVEAVDEGVQSIDALTDEQAASTREVEEMVADVAAHGSEMNETATDVSGAANEQTNSAAAIADSAQTLSDRATRLQTTVDGFAVDAEPSAETSPTGTDDAELSANDMAVEGKSETEIVVSPVGDDSDASERSDHDASTPSQGVTATADGGHPGPRAADTDDTDE
ncbi:MULTISPECIES: methyl-accepting chemotaxis protein [Halomicrobium]|nr:MULTISPECIES: methyl-accepting chemotaxis protein [Halomicrobium]